MTIKEISEKYHISADTLRYYERVGIIPPVPRTPSGIRNYGPKECGWIELAICLRAASLPIQAIIKYVQLCHTGSDTIPARIKLLYTQRDRLIEQQSKSKLALEKVDYKINLYEQGASNGKLPDCLIGEG